MLLGYIFSIVNKSGKIGMPVSFPGNVKRTYLKCVASYVFCHSI